MILGKLPFTKGEINKVKELLQSVGEQKLVSLLLQTEDQASFSIKELSPGTTKESFQGSLAFASDVVADAITDILATEVLHLNNAQTPST